MKRHFSTWKDTQHSSEKHKGKPQRRDSPSHLLRRRRLLPGYPKIINVQDREKLQPLGRAARRSKQRVATRSTNPLLGLHPKELGSRDSNGYLHTRVRSSTSHNGRKVEATQASVERTDKAGSIHTHDRVFFSSKKERGTDTRHSWDEP